MNTHIPVSNNTGIPVQLYYVTPFSNVQLKLFKTIKYQW